MKLPKMSEWDWLDLTAILVWFISVGVLIKMIKIGLAIGQNWWKHV